MATHLYRHDRLCYHISEFKTFVIFMLKCQKAVMILHYEELLFYGHIYFDIFLLIEAEDPCLCNLSQRNWTCSCVYSRVPFCVCSSIINHAHCKNVELYIAIVQINRKEIPYLLYHLIMFNCVKL